MSEEMAKRLHELEAKVQKLEDIEAIIKLKERYARLGDDILNSKASREEAFEILTDDVVMTHAFVSDGVEQKPIVAEGKQALIKHTDAVMKTTDYCVHLISNPCIEVNGNEATGKWYIHLLCTIIDPNGEKVSMWGQGRYEDEYVKIGGEWKVKSFKFLQEFFAPAGAGWDNVKAYDMREVRDRVENG